MQLNKMKPVFVLFVLSLVLVFILGVRYGQSVEKTNKKIDCILSITPTKKPIPSEVLNLDESKVATVSPTMKVSPTIKKL